MDKKSGKALNHFNKKAKGAFVRAAMAQGLETIDDVEGVAKAAGLASRVKPETVELLVPENF